MVKQKSFEIWLHLDVHLQEIVEIVVCNSDIGFKKIGESLYTTKILASKKLLKFMPPRFWLRRNWWKLLPPEERMFHSLLAPLAGYHHSCDVWRTLYISFGCYWIWYFLSNEKIGNSIDFGIARQKLFVRDAQLSQSSRGVGSYVCQFLLGQFLKYNSITV